MTREDTISLTEIGALWLEGGIVSPWSSQYRAA